MVDFSPLERTQQRIVPAIQAGFQLSQRRNALMDLYDNDPTNDRQAMGGLMQSDPATGQQVDTQRFRQQTLQSAQQDAERERDGQRRALLARVMGTANPEDPADYQRRRMALVSRDPAFEQIIPPMPDAEFIAQSRVMLEATSERPNDPSSILALRAAGIDPASPEGREIIRSNLVRPQMFVNPLTGQPSVYNPLPQAQGAPTAVNPDTGERLQYNPQTDQWEPMGGGGGNVTGGF
ncbi:MAG TPA: hypothetical protein VF389_11685 [Woeseiaceae bacterium]